MDRSKLRKVLVNDHSNSSHAYFHSWCSLNELMPGAIIEYEDGRVTSVLAHQIRFLD